jgi:small subunit ribosomal protein S9
MKHPDVLFPRKKAAQFDISGRPFHFLFYTGYANYYNILYELTCKIEDCLEHEDKMWRRGIKHPTEDEKLNITGTTWLEKSELEKLILEEIKDQQYAYFVTSMERLCQLTYANRAKDFIMKYRKVLQAVTKVMEIPPLQYDQSGRAFAQAVGERKRHQKAHVTVREKGTGKIRINNDDIRYFTHTQDREQVLFPLIFSGMLGKVDVEVTVSGGGHSSEAGAVRHGIALALRGFLAPEEVEKMRLAGLLTRDPRLSERKKPGQPGARAKKTWKKR